MAGLPFEPHNIRHAHRYQQKSASEPDRERQRQSPLQVAEIRDQRLVGKRKAPAVPRLELTGPIQNPLLQRNHARGIQIFWFVPALPGRRGEPGYVERVLLRENILHSNEQGGFGGVPIGGIALQMLVYLKSQLIQILARRFILAHLSLIDKILHRLVVVLHREPKRRDHLCARRQFLSYGLLPGIHLAKPAESQHARDEQKD